MRSIQIGAVCSSGWAVIFLCFPKSGHPDYTLIMSGVAHQRLSQVSDVFLRLSKPVIYLHLLQS